MVCLPSENALDVPFNTSSEREAITSACLDMHIARSNAEW